MPPCGGMVRAGPRASALAARFLSQLNDEIVACPEGLPVAGNVAVDPAYGPHRGKLQQSRTPVYEGREGRAGCSPALPSGARLVLGA
jgi:hypothetical protein